MKHAELPIWKEKSEIAVVRLSATHILSAISRDKSIVISIDNVTSLKSFVPMNRGRTISVLPTSRRAGVPSILPVRTVRPKPIICAGPIPGDAFIIDAVRPAKPYQSGMRWGSKHELYKFSFCS
jgi:hypothetical protein